MGDQPQIMDMATSAIAVHEGFMSYVNAGFTRAEALELMKAHIFVSGQQQ